MPRFVVTPWRDPSELKTIRAQFYQIGEFKFVDRRHDAINQISAWRVRKPDFPLALESTSALVAAILQDEAGQGPTVAIRMVYAVAIGRFITGYCDTNQVALFRRSMHEIAGFLNLPISLVEIRHEITHRELPSLIRLRENAQKSLTWLWENYWQHLDQVDGRLADKIALQQDGKNSKEKLQSILKRYVTARKEEIMKKNPRTITAPVEDAKNAATFACEEIVQFCQGREEYHRLLADLLVTPNRTEKCLIPRDSANGLDASMRSAYSLWDKLLYQLHKHQTGFLSLLVRRMVVIVIESNPYAPKQALYEWIIHFLLDRPWTQIAKDFRTKLTEDVLAQCLVNVTQWTLQIAEKIIEGGDEAFQKDWQPVYHAACGNVDASTALQTRAPKDLNCLSTDNTEDLPARTGWAKREGPWPRTAIGALPPV